MGVLVGAAGDNLFARDFIFSNYLDNQVYINPATASMLDNAEVTMTYRNQWPGLSATYVTYSASYAQPVSFLHGGLGLHVTNDAIQQGVLSTTSVNGIYGYYINLDRRTRIGAGIQASLSFRNLSADGFEFESDLLYGMGMGTNGESVPGYTTHYPDFSIGFLGEFDEKYTAGFAVHHLLQPVISDQSVIENRLQRRYSLHAHAIIDVNTHYRRKSIFLMPGIHYHQQQSYQQLNYGTTVHYEPLIMGVWLRQDLGFHFDAAIFLLGISLSNYSFVYSYDVNLSGNHFFLSKMGAHEVTFLIEFQYKSKRKKRGAIKCPDI